MPVSFVPATTAGKVYGDQPQSNLKLYKPTSLEFSRDVEGYQRKYDEKYRWIIYKIIDQQNEYGEGPGEWVNLNQDLLRKFVGERFCKRIIKQLVDSGIINVNGHYSAGNFSRSYRFTDRFCQGTFERYTIQTSKTPGYIRKLNDYRNNQLKPLLNDPVLQQLYFNLQEIEIESTEALEFLSSTMHLRLKSVQFASIIIERIREKSITFRRSDKCGRVFHTLANCPSYLRRFLSYHGEPLIQVDISCSQPVLFCKLIDQYLDERISYKLYNSSISFSSSLSLPYAETIQVPEDVRRYRELTLNGKFYDYLMTEFGLPPDAERGQFKKDFFAHVFYSRLKKNKHRYAKEFRRLFPTADAAIGWHKRKCYKDLPIKLQQIESKLVIGRVCRRIVKENPPSRRPFFFTVHDSIVCLEKDAPYIRSVLQQESNRMLGFQPALKTKPFSGSNGEDTIKHSNNIAA